MKTKLFAIFLILCLLLTVVACTNSKNKNKDTEPTPDNGSQPESQIGFEVSDVDTNTDFSTPRIIPRK